MSHEDMRQEFLEALPRIDLHARIYFRGVTCPHRKADLVAEAVGLAWRWWVRLRERNKDPTQFVSAIATFAARAANCGRTVCGSDQSRCPLSPLTRRLRGLTLTALPAVRTLCGNTFDEALRDNTQTPPDEQACFRLDFPAWLRGYDDRHRGIIEEMMTGEGTQHLASRFGISPGRISQLRRDYKDDWDRFTADPE